MADNNTPLTPPNLNNYSPTHGLDVSQVTSSLDVLSSPSSSDHLNDAISTCMENTLEAQLLMDNSSMNGHFSMGPSLISRSPQVSSATGQQMRRENSSPLLNDSDRSNEADATRNNGNSYLDSYGHIRSTIASSLHSHLQQHSNMQQQQQQHHHHQPSNSPQHQNSHNIGPGPMSHSPPLHRNHPYQRSEPTTSSTAGGSSNSSSNNNNNNNQNLVRSPAEMTLNEYNRSEGTPEELLRRAPLKIRSSEALTAIPPNPPPTTSSSPYILNAMHDGNDAYRMTLKQEPETGY